MNTIDTHSLLTGPLTGSQRLTNTVSATAGADQLDSADFATILKSMLVNVSQSQQHATRLAESFELGQHQDLAGVMVGQQKAKLAFQTTLQVRNKLMSAYQDIMNMPV
jgi:flagellar hook-basal body complex protein FliE